MFKTCPKCNKEKNVSEFYNNKKRKDGLHSYCIECKNAYDKIHNATPEYTAKRKTRNGTPDGKASNRASHLNKNYPGFTHDKYDALLTAQMGHCAICPATNPGGNHKHFLVDHDHKCCPGRKTCGNCIRGLLCYKCNTSLGGFDDDPMLLYIAMRYLEKAAHPSLKNI